MNSHFAFHFSSIIASRTVANFLVNGSWIKINYLPAEMWTNAEESLDILAGGIVKQPQQRYLCQRPIFIGLSHRTGRHILDHCHTYDKQTHHPHPSLRSDMIHLKSGIFSFILPEPDYRVSLIGYFLLVPTPNSLKITQSFGLMV